MTDIETTNSADYVKRAISERIGISVQRNQAITAWAAASVALSDIFAQDHFASIATTVVFGSACMAGTERQMSRRFAMNKIRNFQTRLLRLTGIKPNESERKEFIVKDNEVHVKNVYDSRAQLNEDSMVTAVLPTMVASLTTLQCVERGIFENNSLILLALTAGTLIADKLVTTSELNTYAHMAENLEGRLT